MNPLIFPILFTSGFTAYLAILLWISLKHQGPTLRLPWEYHLTLVLTAASHAAYYYATLTGQPAGLSLLLAMGAFVIGGQRFLSSVLDQWKR